MSILQAIIIAIVEGITEYLSYLFHRAYDHREQPDGYSQAGIYQTF